MHTQTTTHPLSNPALPSKAAYLKWVFLAAGACALGAGLIFLAGLIVFRMPGVGSLLALLRGNWLITIFSLHAGQAGVQLSDLYRLNALDLVLLGLIAATQAGLYCALQGGRRVLALIALVQPPLGMLLFLLTQNAGRSAVMGAGLVMSVAMLSSQVFRKWTGWLGLLASILLLAGDLGVDLAPNTTLAVSTAIGYILLTGWCFVTGRRLLQLAR